MSDDAQKTTLRLRYCGSGGISTIEGMREVVRSTTLVQQGDAVLIWVNQGDLLALQRAGIAQEASDA